MMVSPRSLPLGMLLLASLGAQTKQAPDQQAFQRAEASLARRASAFLAGFASFAKAKKVRPRAREAYDRILEFYDSNNKVARRLLGYHHKRGGGWMEPPPETAKEWVDDANNKQRFAVVSRWHQTALKLARLHRQRGLALIGDGDGPFVAAGMAHLRRAVFYDPFDEEAHLALGHKPCQLGDKTYYGTAEQVAFIKKMRDVETTALMLAKKDYEVDPVEQIPEPLEKLNLEFHGARSKYFTVFTRGSQQNADDLVKWGERSLDFLEYCLGPKRAKRTHVRRKMKYYAWTGFLWTRGEREKFLEINPKLRPEKGKEFANISWGIRKGLVTVLTALTPAQMQDNMIGITWHRVLAGNAGLMEGVVHAATWYLKSTSMTRFGAVPEGTVGSRDLELPKSTNWWLRKIRDEARGGTDLPINNVPRVPLWKFTNDARLKSWNFMTWLIARYPGRWYEFVNKAPRKKIPFPEEIDKLGESIFKMPLAEVEGEWREWASGRGVTAAATGYGPPLLPEKPNDNEVAGLERLNKVRSLAGYWGGEAWAVGLPPCQLDAEASIACRLHARFLGLHEEHHKWPEAHEEDPAKEGFTPRGMRAGLRSVIVINARDAADSIDSWIGTVYHRFPLLQYNINRFGFGFEDDMCVLDMGSLEEPHTPAGEKKYGVVVWPPNGMKNVPRAFAFFEYPNPLADVGVDLDGQKEVGYPVSLQMSDTVANQIAGASIELFEAKKRGGRYFRGASVPCFVHTPNEPMLKRMELRNVVFAIPKSHLEPNTAYKVVVTLQFSGGEEEREWAFTTGSQMHLLGRR